MIVNSKQRVQGYRARAADLRAKSETMTNIKDLNDALLDAEIFERMADWEERKSFPFKRTYH